MENTTPAKKVTTPEQKAKKDARKAATATAKNLIREYVGTPEAIKAIPGNVIEAISLLIAKAKGGGGGGRKGTSVLDTLFAKVGDAQTELALFKATKKGRSEIKKLVRNGLKNAAPESRKWISFDEKTETWTLVGLGSAAPKGWTGFDANKPGATA